MSILVTGGAGYIGSHMVHRLVDLGEKSVIVLDDLSAGFAWALPAHVILVRADVGNSDALDQTMKKHAVDTILHFAASTIVPESVRDPLQYYGNNTRNSLALLAAAVANGVRRFVFSSTAAVYGDDVPSPTSEASPTSPTSPYGWSKLMTERMLQDTARATNLPFIVLRYFNACGADPQLRTGQSTRNATHLIKVAAQAAVGIRDHIAIYGADYPTPDGTCIRDYVHVWDLVEAHALALDYLAKGGPSAIFNCGYGHGYSVLEVLQAVQRVSGIKFSTAVEDRRPGDRAESVADSRRLREVLKWRPRFDDLDTIASHAVTWERELVRRSHT